MEPEIKAAEIFHLCKKGGDLLSIYRPVSEEGRFEAIIFNSLIVLNRVQSNYPNAYESISDNFFLFLFNEAREISIQLDNETLLELINSRYNYYDQELQSLYSKGLPGGIHYLFFEEPLNQTPGRSDDLNELLLFSKVLFSMIKFVSNLADNI